MPLILDEMAKRDGLEFHGIQGAAVITIQKIRPTEKDRGTFPADLLDKSIGVISVYPADTDIAPFYLDAKQTLEYLMNPRGQRIDIYAQAHRYGVRCTERPDSKLHIMLLRDGRLLSVGYFELDALRQWMESVSTEYPEFFT